MNVSIDGRSNITTNVMIGLEGDERQCISDTQTMRTYEYHSHAEYSVLRSNETVLRPE